MALKHALVNVFANLGVSVGQQSDLSDVEALLAMLHPRVPDQPLIRMGCAADGGYLLPDDLDGIAALFSPGVDDRATFEHDILARGIPCFLADATCTQSPISDPAVHFLPKFVGVVNDERTITLDQWVSDCAPDGGDLMLQMDIEGAEWPVLLNLSDAVLARFRIIVVELHHLDQLLDRHGFRIIQAVMTRLLDRFTVVHNHPNNFGGAVVRGALTVPRVLEMTLQRSDRLSTERYATRFPHPLDVRNASNRREVVLPKQWYRS